MNLVDELHAIAAALEGAGIKYAVCGGVAVTIHGHVRNTKDGTEHMMLDLLDVERLESPDAG